MMEYAKGSLMEVGAGEERIRMEEQVSKEKLATKSKRRNEKYFKF